MNTVADLKLNGDFAIADIGLA
ncbi:MAG: hypothetical protein RLY18_1283, partial [Pseudomonadota bacterium]